MAHDNHDGYKEFHEERMEKPKSRSGPPAEADLCRSTCGNFTSSLEWLYPPESVSFIRLRGVWGDGADRCAGILLPSQVFHLGAGLSGPFGAAGRLQRSIAAQPWRLTWTSFRSLV
jgi:hypothetical protein